MFIVDTEKNKAWSIIVNEHCSYTGGVNRTFISGTGATDSLLAVAEIHYFIEITGSSKDANIKQGYSKRYQGRSKAYGTHQELQAKS